ncbi:ATP-grasp domain-containing protein [Acetivibrio mesophilus]|uniref:ATP-grasp domain-containing protein n=1 Tax=Acetivibrio mesophilus TaxID=2487273 RepID=A0A4Q0I1D6_9FIRM|nr:alpha-L-glutamate ligase [Acetivibrio mesophilus]ODM27239.1 alpha-L-glutamate ligase [Clostridium sp. Bc-iso-3]RXE58064.1 hypothetical protein EFD62_14465 [Acetivibrio mesophilus]
MRFITFDPFRALGIPDVTYIKPELIFAKKDVIKEADWVLFPEYWQVNLLHYVWKKNIFPSINTYHLGHDKVEMTRALQAFAPQHLPYTLIAPSNTDVEIIMEQFDFPFVAKEVRNSMGKGVHLISNSKDLKDYMGRNEILYLQEYLPIDRDIRLVLVGKKVVFAYWRIGQQGSFKNNVAQGGSIDFSPVPREVIELVEDVASNLGIDYAGFDVAMVGEHPYFFEFNVMFGNQAIVQAQVPLVKYILDYVNEKNSPHPPKPLAPAPSPRAS